MISTLKKMRVRVMNAWKNGRERLGYIKRKCVAPAIPANADGKVYVNLGCGSHTSPEFINIDTRPMPMVHYIHEVQHLPMLSDQSVDLLYASHLVEHIPRAEVLDTFKEWKRVLKVGGVVRFGVPDFDALLEIYALSGKKVDAIVNQLLGQNAPYDDHHTIWNFEYAKGLLEQAGFGHVRLWDPATADHHAFVDKTMRTVRVAGREIPISLNIEATRP